jgi:hypothetical protein
MTAKPLNVAEFVVTCMNNQKQMGEAEKRKERDRDPSLDRPENG